MNKNIFLSPKHVHPNAFNHQSYLKSGVDPRTGLFSAHIILAGLGQDVAEAPLLPLILAFNSLSTDDLGYGIGWSLQLSCFDSFRSQLFLFTGASHPALCRYRDINQAQERFQIAERFQVKASGDHLEFRNRKLKTFVLEKQGSDLLIKHKSGVIERLRRVNATMYMPVEISAPEGYTLHLSYADFNGHCLLKEVRDDRGVLCRIERSDGIILVTLFPGQIQEARYRIELDNGQVTSVQLPVDNSAGWRFRYRRMHEMLFITRLDTPEGGAEIIHYQDQGHTLPPEGPYSHLPYVVSLISSPRSGQPETTTTYRYTTKNFLGYGAPNLVWQEDEDNLYQVTTDYEYGSVETLMRHHQDGLRAVRTVSRLYNRFHLMLSEVTNQNGKVRRNKYDYRIIPGLPFQAQPEQCRLPIRKVSSFYLSCDTACRHEDVTETEYDDYGNLLYLRKPSGIQEKYVYYHRDGEPGCPADPLGLVRSVKSKTVTPAQITHATLPAPVVQTRYKYAAFTATSSGNPAFLRPVHESVWETDIGHEILRISREMEYALAEEEPYIHGRLLQQMDTQNALVTVNRFVYSIDHHELKTYRSTIGFDSRRKEQVDRRCLLTGRLLSLQDEEEVRVEWEYDSLGRVVRETVAGNTEISASRIYRYKLCANDSDQAEQVNTDASGVMTRVLFDGFYRILRVETQDADGEAPVFRTIYDAEYNELGQMVEESNIDWLDGEALVLTHGYEYDDWGFRSRVKRPDGVTECCYFDPARQTEMSWLESAEQGVSARTVTASNHFGKPIIIEHLNAQDQSVDKTLFIYDGLGRCISKTDPLLQITTYEYDFADRLITRILPDDTEVLYSYSSTHSTLPLVTEVRVNDVCVGVQEYDGLSRLIQRRVGGRSTSYFYEGSLNKPLREQLPGGDIIEYRYEPQLNQQVTDRYMPSAWHSEETQYEYHPLSAQLIRSDDPDTDWEYIRDYYPSGKLQREIWMQSGHMEEAVYKYSLQGRLIEYRDPFGSVQRCFYDDCGRMERLQYGDMSVTFNYNEFGRLSQYDLEEHRHNRSMTTAMEYDELGREWSRSISCSGLDPYVMTQSYTADGKVARRLVMQGETLIRDESYEYDSRGRLQYYYCDGDHPPQDANGETLRAQSYDYDTLDNVIKLTSHSDCGENVAIFHYDNLSDPCQLTGISHSRLFNQVDLHYDDNGNLSRLYINGDCRILHYDPMGHLIQTDSESEGILSLIRYNALGRLEIVEQPGQPHVQRRYYGHQVVVEARGPVRRRYIFHEGKILGILESEGYERRTIFYGLDMHRSPVLRMFGDKVTEMAFGPYGMQSSDSTYAGEPGYRGELSEEITGCYMTGQYQRPYSPELMRFISPDSQVSFCDASVNAYACYFGPGDQQEREKERKQDQVTMTPSEQEALFSRTPWDQFGKQQMIQTTAARIRVPGYGLGEYLKSASSGRELIHTGTTGCGYLGEMIYRETRPVLGMVLRNLRDPGAFR
ncbi:RHS repeat domain-containing protein [Hahella ganghwensis]|uniref:RHS repeat domain-containing protein n=1 Tax=Hahella ganghwensis TaxID=286420 RepID=UPI000376EAB9|nr:RHS repeat protein [Hahella ganghwensis]